MISEKDMILYKRELRLLISKVAKNDTSTDALLKDLLTPKEYDECAVRLQIIKMLAEGKTHRDISKKLKVGVATVNRGARELSDKNGLFSKVFLKK